MRSRFIARRSSRSMRACTRSARKYRVKSASIRPGFLRKTGAISCTELRSRELSGNRTTRCPAQLGGRYVPNESPAWNRGVGRRQWATRPRGLEVSTRDCDTDTGEESGSVGVTTRRVQAARKLHLREPECFFIG